MIMSYLYYLKSKRSKTKNTKHEKHRSNVSIEDERTKTVHGTTANEGTRGSLVRMTPDVVYYSWAAFDTSI